MPSFDVVSEVDKHELANAVDQSNRELATRFDFKGSNALFVLADDAITLTAPSDFQLKQMQPILEGKLVKRGLDVQALQWGEIATNLAEAKQTATVQQGIDAATAKQIVKSIKVAKLKVQAAIQGEQVRVTGKKRDDLQATIQHLKEEEWTLPLQYVNFRD